ncbi:Uncharacterised protein [Legionella donaldsonii]|uniref:Uncharacterized protein n=1 Tax=Legionella donaldsonii TaxID=45060 RepID=A0A378IYK6_9GAMM|nr:hypothetical protein [Legionella donaldsonii]STX40533.1 Uncharacterised protein [Legionella donaldsonii]
MNYRKKLSHVNAFRVYAMVFLILYDRHYFFSLCYRKGAGLSTTFVPFYFNASCLYLAVFTIFLSGLLLLLLTALLFGIYRFFSKKNTPPLLVNLLIIVLITWLLHLLSPFSLVT